MKFSLNTLILGVAVIAGAILIVLTHSEATQTCNVEWELKLKDASAKLEAKVAEQNAKIRELERTLVKAVEDRKVEMEAHAKTIEKQRETVPLSKACSECRIPRDRIWLRSSDGNRGGTGS